MHAHICYLASALLKNISKNGTRVNLDLKRRVKGLF